MTDQAATAAEPISKESTAEALAATRHYGAMRFSMMAAYFILWGLLLNAYINWKDETQRLAIVYIGLLASLWFAWLEFLLSYNLTKLWTLLTRRGDAAYSQAWPQRNPVLIWLARVTLPLPYLAAIATWGSLLHLPGVASWVSSALALAIWIAFTLGWLAAERGRL